ncbi:hypothetical protein BGX28_006883, partial [Mortierella sp. GBA30]
PIVPIPIPPAASSATTTTTTTTTTTAVTTTTTVAPSPTTTTTLATSDPIPSATTTIPTLITTPPTSIQTSVPPPTLAPSPLTTGSNIIGTSSAQPAPSISPATKDSTTPSNVPVIVGSVVGAAAVIIIVATTIICFRRRRRHNKDLTFDTLEGFSSPGTSHPQRASQRYNANAGAAVGALPGVGRPSNVHHNGGYDDIYDGYDDIGPGGGGGFGSHMAHHHPPHQGYGEQHLGYDAYGTPLQGYQNPSIFQEDSLAYSNAANIMGRNQPGFEQALPEIVYRNGDDLTSGGVGANTGYYEDDMYNHQAGWNQNMSGGYIGPKGLWIANPTTDNQYGPQQQQQDHDIELVQQKQPEEATMTYEKNSMNQYENTSDTMVGSPQSKFRGHNPQALPESPRLQQLRGGDLFGQDGEATSGLPSAPRAATAQAGSGSLQEVGASPRLASRDDMKSFELARHSPPRSSGEGVQSYANDLTPPPVPRPSIGERPSMDSPSKSLRTLRREDWS